MSQNLTKASRKREETSKEQKAQEHIEPDREKPAEGQKEDLEKDTKEDTKEDTEDAMEKMNKEKGKKKGEEKDEAIEEPTSEEKDETIKAPTGEEKNETIESPTGEEKDETIKEAKDEGKKNEQTASQKRSIDRRTLYTKNLIKDAMLTLIGKKGFEKITIAELCKLAQLSRTTFYLHYDKLTDVLDELVIDALGAARPTSQTPQDINELAALMRKTPTIEGIMDSLNLLPICQRVADHPRYHAMFLDESASHYILMSIYHSERGKAISMLDKAFSLSESQADAIFLFALTGAFAVNKSCRWEKNQDWYEKQKALMTFLDGGYTALKKL